MARLQKKKPTDTKLKKRVKKTGDDSGQVGAGTSSIPAAALAKVKKTSVSKGSAKPFTATKVAAVGKPNWIQKSIQFLREVKVELKKVTWPSRKQTLGSTAVVLVLVVLISLFLGLVDMGLTSFVRLVLQ